MSRIVGIDLGTTNCCIAVMDGSKPKVLANKFGYNTTPSVIAITDEGNRVVGQIAVRQTITNPEHTVYGAKRLMGRTWGSEEVDHAVEHSSFRIVEGPNGDIRIILHGRRYSVPELGAVLLQEMRIIAEDFLGAQVDRAVVTVPAYFNDTQRQAVRDAGTIAGLDVVRILNEPTAAALAYGYGTQGPKTIAVYDLGGGTFDISIVRIDTEGEFHVISTTGDSYLGGEDFDERLMDTLMERFMAEHGVNLAESPISLARVRQAAQKAKADLSTLTQVDINLPFIVSSGPTGPLSLDYTLKREELERITSDLVTRTLQICEVGLKFAEMRPSEIDEVILVGGMTRMPAVQRACGEFFETEPKKGVHPDEVVALGAAIAGHAIGEGTDDVKLHDVTAHSLGIMTAGGGCDPLIMANTQVPIDTREIFGTSRDRQTTVKIVVLQGESERAAENYFLGRFALTGLREAPAGEVEIEVTFRIDEDGIFSVKARDIETGEERSIDVLASSGLSEEEIELMVADSAEYLALRRAEEAAERSRQSCEVLIEEMTRMLPEAQDKLSDNPMGQSGIRSAQRAVEKVRASLSAADAELLESHRELLERMRDMLHKVMERAGG